MFDIGFSEILVIAVVALIVIGPERLPGFARTLGHLFGRMQRYVNDVKADIQREIELDELKKFKQEVENSARSIEQSVTSEATAVEQELRKIETLANPLAADASPPAAREAVADAPAAPQVADGTPAPTQKPG
jgi:sec-independent protein translocase protein TatB